MALRKCKECGQQISTTAKACPSCGATGPAGATTGQTLGGCGCLVLIVLGIAGVIGSNSGPDAKKSPAPPSSSTPSAPSTATAEAVPTPAVATCATDWSKCKDNEDMANHFGGWGKAKVRCEMAAEKAAKYGSPVWPWLPFGSFMVGHSYVKTGNAVLVEPDAQFDNGLGSKVHVQVRCEYDLRQEAVTDIRLSDRD